jgi:hypothetical protein
MGHVQRASKQAHRARLDFRRREAQLADIESLCRRLSVLFAANRDSRAAELLSAKAAHAARLLRDGYTQSDLNELGGDFPDGAGWLNPKSLDYNAAREPWQDEVAQLHGLARALALDLRSTATLYPDASRDR